MHSRRKLPRVLLCLAAICFVISNVGCSPRDFLTRRLAGDLIAASEEFKAPQLFSLRSGVYSNKEFNSPDIMVMKRRGWIVGTAQKQCPVGIQPPPCWDVVLSPLGVDAIRPLISTAMPSAGTVSLQTAYRQMDSISGISKAGNFADVEFLWHWASLNQVGAALYDSGVHYRSTVGFRKFDDGWKLVDKRLPANQSLENALKNAQPAQ